MSRKPGYLVQFLTKEMKRQFGRTFNNEQPIQGKLVVYYLTNDFKEEYEEVDGKKVWKKRLISPDRLTVRGMCD